MDGWRLILSTHKMLANGYGGRFEAIDSRADRYYSPKDPAEEMVSSCAFNPTKLTKQVYCVQRQHISARLRDQRRHGRCVRLLHSDDVDRCRVLKCTSQMQRLNHGMFSCRSDPCRPRLIRRPLRTRNQRDRRDLQSPSIVLSSPSRAARLSG